jgi:hypothetical protein
MTPPVLPKVASELIRSVRVYADENAFLRDERGRPHSNFQLKTVHDELFQAAIKLKLASRLCILDWKRPAGFRNACRVEVERASWWPANVNAKNKRGLLGLALAPASEAALGNAWLPIRALAEEGHRATLWHDDPALGFSPSPGIWLGRTACTGHEGLAYYFVYGRERSWEEAVEGAGLAVCARGEEAYHRHFGIAGRLGG